MSIDIPPPTNGRPASKEAERLAKGSYADRAVEGLAGARFISDDFIRRALGEFHPDQVTVQDRKRMRQDPIIKMAMWYTKAPIIRAEQTIECEDPAIQAGMTEIWNNVRQTLMKVALLKYDYGFQGTIKQFQYGRIDATYEDPNSGETRKVWDDEGINPIILGRPIPLPPETTRVELKRGRFAGIRTPLARTEDNGNTRENSDLVPPEWCMWYANEFEEEHFNYYGRARIDPAYRAWYSYWFNWYNRDRHAENDADPALQVWYPPGTSWTGEVDAQGKKIMENNRDRALQIGHDLRNGGTIAWPSDVHTADDGKVTTQKLWEAAFLTGGENLSSFNDLLDQLRLDKLRACLVPDEALNAIAGTGSRATQGGRVEIFIQSLEQSSLYLDDLHTRYYLRPIVEANWGKDAPPVKLQTTGFQEEDLTLATTLIEAAFNADPNALPIDFEELCRRAALPLYTAKEQEERDKMAEEAKQQAMAQQQEAMAQQAPPEATGAVPPGQAGPDLQALAASQEGARTGPRKYERETIYLSGTLDTTAPGWAQREGRRRQKNIEALSERLHDVAFRRYEDVFEAAASSIEDHEEELHLGVTDVVRDLVSRIWTAITGRRELHMDAVTGELAGVYHASGLAELNRLGLSAESWDVGRDEVQEWARFRAGELVKTIDQTVVEQHIRPWLTQALSQAGYGHSPQGIPVSTLELAAQLRDKFSSYPQWMAERLVRTESMRGYNLSAADMWERVGVIEVEEYDGLGGKSGKTDAECLARNGQVVSIDQFREDTEKEHPNGTLGAVPVTVTAELRPLNPGPVALRASQSRSIYAVTSDGLILSQAETGTLLAEDVA